MWRYLSKTSSALLIGINYNNDTSHKLNGCINDARNVKKVLQSMLDYPESNITLLTDDTQLPTRKNIEDGFQSLLLKINSRECSEAWIHYSGHGYFLTDHGNPIIDIHRLKIDNPIELENQLK